MNLLLFRPRIFISYSRKDKDFVDRFVYALGRRGFIVFRDTSHIDPGDNFVNTLSQEISRASVIIAVVTKNYSASRWAQAELYYGIGSGTFIIPLVIFDGQINDLDEPLIRLLRDIQYLAMKNEDEEADAVEIALKSIETPLNKIISRNTVSVLRKYAPHFALAIFLIFGTLSISNFALYIFGGLLFIFGLWITLYYSRNMQQARKREYALRQIKDANGMLTSDSIRDISSLISGDQQAFGEVCSMSQELNLPNVTRLNALALGGELRKGQREWRWYIKDIDFKKSHLVDVTFVNATFLGGRWTNIDVNNSTFSGTFWCREPELFIEGVTFRKVQFFGGEIEAINLVDVKFVNSKFRGIVVDTTNFRGTKFATEEEPRLVDEGNPYITPSFTLFERSSLVSNREPPEKGVLDLTKPGDEIIFDDVMFSDCRFEGWFNPDWFRNSTFERCQLPQGMSEDNLVNAGNIVTMENSS